MEKKKLVLSEIQITSFITNLEPKEQQTILGAMGADTKLINTCAYTQQNANACYNYTANNCQASFTCVTQIPANCASAKIQCGGNSRTNCNTQNQAVCALESVVKLCFVPASDLIFNC
ncbi:MAG: pinensin family lanthipeptide [Bacteroidetes bacterium]|nr:pinensin family lanthipeptide [Bacteroidota bacterium]